ncbi:hypothetical protein LOK49_LG14G00422 [Camellia lanceoleosa]|uniref:Uncharacterized protein n=1 Tax=Camellia lanceoleosa TaxID=1840588 RepID=A0ACC0FA50_9ERIC|nr:hypothetical protein LOK49_LG14G00422 [Camellia lanceoleosa]
MNIREHSHYLWYASSFYGPFREALESNPRFGDKKIYQMNPANYREALVEAHEDKSKGADILLVKLGLPYLDIIRLLRDNSPLPIATYQFLTKFRIPHPGRVFFFVSSFVLNCHRFRGFSDPQERLKNLLRHSGNGFCADCGSPNPKWV